jgi:hypothetical protein
VSHLVKARFRGLAGLWTTPPESAFGRATRAKARRRGRLRWCHYPDLTSVDGSTAPVRVGSAAGLGPMAGRPLVSGRPLHHSPGASPRSRVLHLSLHGQARPGGVLASRQLTSIRHGGDIELALDLRIPVKNSRDRRVAYEVRTAHHPAWSTVLKLPTVNISVPGCFWLASPVRLRRAKNCMSA